jgi:hypothetical protein
MESKNEKGELLGNRSLQQKKNDESFKNTALQQIKDSGDNWAIHSLAVMKRNSLARVLYLNDLYKEILSVPGVICEFGVHWGASFSTLLNLRNLYEPYNVERMMYGFDTFEGFCSVSSKDGSANVGDYSSIDGYENTLHKILTYHESISAFQDRTMFELIKGDATKTVDTWLENNPGASIALAIFDMDVYAPTKDVLEKIMPRLTKNSVLVFDEFVHRKFPGEVQAVREVLDLMNADVSISEFQSHCAIVRFT